MQDLAFRCLMTMAASVPDTVSCSCGNAVRAGYRARKCQCGAIIHASPKVWMTRHETGVLYGVSFAGYCYELHTAADMPGMQWVPVRTTPRAGCRKADAAGIAMLQTALANVYCANKTASTHTD